MSFSSGIVSSVGISLGDLEIATDYLFANPEFYEPELTEVKSTISNKNISTIQRITKPNKPKITKEAIINKFSIVPISKVTVKDEVVETSAILIDNSSFDFSFDDMDNKQLELNESMDEANNLMQKLAMTNISTQLLSDNDDYNDADIDSEIDDISFESSEEDDLDIESDEIDIDDDFDIESDEYDIDDIEDIDDIDGINDIDDIEEIDDTPTYNHSTNLTDSLDIDDSNDFDIDDIEDIDDIDDSNDFDIDDIDDIDIDDIDDIDAIDDIDNIDELDIEDDDTKMSATQHAHNNSTVNIKLEQSKEIEELKRRVSETELAMKQMLNSDSVNNTSSVLKNNNFEKVDSVDSLVDRATKSNKVNTSYNEYSVMTIDELFKHVKHYMNIMGVDRRTVDISALNSRFGEANIKKLIQKSYLIKIGKGVTTGR